jgi:hypothetical protein
MVLMTHSVENFRIFLTTYICIIEYLVVRNSHRIFVESNERKIKNISQLFGEKKYKYL